MSRFAGITWFLALALITGVVAAIWLLFSPPETTSVAAPGGAPGLIQIRPNRDGTVAVGLGDAEATYLATQALAKGRETGQTPPLSDPIVHFDDYGATVSAKWHGTAIPLWLTVQGRLDPPSRPRRLLLNSVKAGRLPVPMFVVDRILAQAGPSDPLLIVNWGLPGTLTNVRTTDNNLTLTTDSFILFQVAALLNASGQPGLTADRVSALLGLQEHIASAQSGFIAPEQLKGVTAVPPSASGVKAPNPEGAGTQPGAAETLTAPPPGTPLVRPEQLPPNIPITAEQYNCLTVNGITNERINQVIMERRQPTVTELAIAERCLRKQ